MVQEARRSRQGGRAAGRARDRQGDARSQCAERRRARTHRRRERPDRRRRRAAWDRSTVQAPARPPPRSLPPLPPLQRPRTSMASVAAKAAPAASMPPAPSAAKIAAEHNLDLGAIAGSGKRGQVLKGDVLGGARRRPRLPSRRRPLLQPCQSRAHDDPGRRGARGARAPDQAAPDDRAAPQGGAEHRRHADDLQRGRHDRGDGAAGQVQRRFREEARREARLHGLLRQSLRPGAEGDPRRQRRDRRRRSRLQELLSPRHRRRHGQGPRRAGGARRRSARHRRRSRRRSPISASARATASSGSRRCRAARSPSPTAASMAR